MYEPFTKLLITHEYQLKQKTSCQLSELCCAAAARVHTQLPTSCTAERRGRTLPRRCTAGTAGRTDTSWPSEEHNKHRSLSQSAIRSRPARSEVAALTSVSYSSVLLSDSSSFPYCFHREERGGKKVKSEKRRVIRRRRCCCAERRTWNVGLPPFQKI